MDIFKLPDLGEGLPDAEISEWFIKEGDVIKLDEPLVSMETAKAVVDVPSPQDGVVVKCYGKPGDIIKTGDPLIAFASEEKTPTVDKGTVVGSLEESNDVGEDTFTVGAPTTRKPRIKAIPAIKLLAKKLNVDLQTISPTGENGLITREDVQRAAQQATTPLADDEYTPLKGVRRAMVNSMTQSHREVVPVSIYDEADISAWSKDSNITVRLIRAITHAVTQEPALNALFNGEQCARKCSKTLNLGLAMDSDEGLFVPVIHNAGQHSDSALRTIINNYKTAVSNRSIPVEKLSGATFTLSNFGKFAGRYASPIVVPPTVAILAVGRLYQGAVSVDGNIVSHPLLPLSLTFDHRAATGGEATRFLGAIISALQKAN